MKTSLPALFISVLFLLAGTGCANIHHIAIDRGNVMPVANITPEQQAKLEDLYKGLQAGKQYVFFIAKGQSIPLKATVTLPMAKVEPGKNSVVFTQDTYLLISKSGLMIGPDGERWALIQDLKTQKELFGIGKEKGHFMIGFGITKEEGPLVTVDVGVN
jgi:hypothetical protein